MGTIMAGEPRDLVVLQRRIDGGDETALLDLFTRHRERLKRMVKLRLDSRLQGRIDPSDVLQEACIDVVRRGREYLANPSLPAFLWLRWVTGERLLSLHRRHLGSKMRDAGVEVSLHRGSLPQASSVSLAAMLLGRLTSPTRAAQRAELQLRLQDSVNALDPAELNNNETAEVLGISAKAASHRYIRALKRLKDALAGMPGFFGP
jgi:RNA polymerase sigma-70 factor, ECF subfamily